MTKNLIIISAGKLGREVFGWASQTIAHGAPWRIKGFLDGRANALDGYKYDSKIIGNVDEYVIEDGDVFIGAIGEPKDKVKYYTPILKKGGKFINLIHPRANLGHNVDLGAGIVMGPFSSTTSDVKIGNFVTLIPFSNVAHDAVIGDWCQICGHSGINGNVTLGEGVFLGSHSCIIPQMTVGPWAYVGAGSVVVKNVAAGARVFGNPARPIVTAEQKSGKQLI